VRASKAHPVPLLAQIKHVASLLVVEVYEIGTESLMRDLGVVPKVRDEFMN
jgi:hypothetical protein